MKNSTKRLFLFFFIITSIYHKTSESSEKNWSIQKVDCGLFNSIKITPYNEISLYKIISALINLKESLKFGPIRIHSREDIQTQGGSNNIVADFMSTFKDEVEEKTLKTEKESDKNQKASEPISKRPKDAISIYDLDTEESYYPSDIKKEFYDFISEIEKIKEIEFHDSVIGRLEIIDLTKKDNEEISSYLKNELTALITSIEYILDPIVESIFSGMPRGLGLWDRKEYFIRNHMKGSKFFTPRVIKDLEISDKAKKTLTEFKEKCQALLKQEVLSIRFSENQTHNRTALER